jgi:hypothetical protein
MGDAVAWAVFAAWVAVLLSLRWWVVPWAMADRPRRAGRCARCNLYGRAIRSADPNAWNVATLGEVAAVACTMLALGGFIGFAVAMLK